MKSNYILIVFLITFSLSCSSGGENAQSSKYKRIIYHSLNKNFSDTLYYPTDKTLITRIEILLSGKIQGSGILEIENGSGRFNKIELNGDINEVYRTEWYQNKCLIKYVSQEFVVGDSLIVKYRIW